VVAGVEPREKYWIDTGNSSQFWRSSTIEAPKISPQRRPSIKRPSKMVRHDLKSTSVHELVASNRAEPVMHASEFLTQRKRIQRLTDYCKQALGEIRASLDRTQ
jgi:hypothetical protein